MEALNVGIKCNVEVIPGIEFTAEEKFELHILGYYLDIHTPWNESSHLRSCKKL